VILSNGVIRTTYHWINLGAVGMMSRYIVECVEHVALEKMPLEKPISTIIQDIIPKKVFENDSEIPAS